MSTNDSVGDRYRWVKDGALSAGRMRYGADYNPEQWPARSGPRTCASCGRPASTSSRSASSRGRCSSPRPGEWDFGWLDEVIDLLHDNGIDVDLATATASPPPWLTRLHPEVLPVTDAAPCCTPAGGSTGGRHRPVFRFYALRLVRKMAERYADHPALVAWHISNELGCHNVFDYSDDAARAFRDWLRGPLRHPRRPERRLGHGLLVAALRRVGARSCRRASRPTHLNPGRQLDFERFSSRRAPRLPARRERGARRGHSVGPADHELHGDGGVPVDRLRDVGRRRRLRLERPLPASGRRRRDELSFSANLTGNLALGRPWFLMEHATSAVNWRDVNTAKREGELARDALTHVGHGADAVCFFQWRQSRAGGERYHSAMVPHAGEDSRVFRDVADLGRDLGDLAPVTGSHRVPARVAILFDWESWWVAERDSHPRTGSGTGRKPSTGTPPPRPRRASRRAPGRLVVRRLRRRHRADAPRRVRRRARPARGVRRGRRRTWSSRTSPAPSTSTTASGSAGTPGRFATCSACASRSSAAAARPAVALSNGASAAKWTDASAVADDSSRCWPPTKTAPSRGRRRSPAGR